MATHNSALQPRRTDGKDALLAVHLPLPLSSRSPSHSRSSSAASTAATRHALRQAILDTPVRRAPYHKDIVGGMREADFGTFLGRATQITSPAYVEMHIKCNLLIVRLALANDRFREAEPYARRASKLAAKLGDEPTIGRAAYWHGRTLVAAEAYEEAVEQFEESRKAYGFYPEGELADYMIASVDRLIEDAQGGL